MSANRTILIYTEVLTNRLSFVCDFVFTKILQVKYKITVNQTDSIDNSIILEYLSRPSGQQFWIYADGLCSQSNQILDQDPALSGSGENAVLYPCPIDGSIVGFDIFSAIFYCLSLYDAYRPLPKDEHQRIDFKFWFLRRSQLDQYPMVEIWLHKLRLFLEEQGVACTQAEQFQRMLTFDIDHPFAYTNRPLQSHLKALTGDIIKGRWSMLQDRMLTWLSIRNDPNESVFGSLKESSGITFKFFWLMRQGGLDSLNYNSPSKQLCIKKIAKLGEIGLHPSYRAGKEAHLFHQEYKLLTAMSNQVIQSSRQHFLRQEIPVSQRILLEAGISHDYSIGYYDTPGLMAGTTLSFPFYDVERDEQTALQLVPFFWMDAMNKYYRSVDQAEERREINRWEVLLKHYGGTACYIFHNDSWRESRYQDLIKSLSEC
jgi:hypothetical protein